MTLKVTSKFGLCGLPISIDTYKNCSFGCVYCFANMGVSQANVKDKQSIIPIDNSGIKNRLDRIKKGEHNKESFLDMLIAEGVTWHCGGMSDPWQPAEKELHSTANLLKITNKYDISILFSTKTAEVDFDYLRPELHSFQLSVTNIDNRYDIEPNVSPMQKRHELYKELKNRGFRVGIRLQPFIPNITTLGIIELFNDADYYTFEGIKLVPSTPQEKRFGLLDLLNLKEQDFISLGLLSLHPDIRLEHYKPFAQKLDSLGIGYSYADNDLHHISKSKCCCGEALVNKSTDFNTTAMFYKNANYSKTDLIDALGVFEHCSASTWIFTHSQGGFYTVRDFFEGRYDDSSSPWSKKFMYHRQPMLF